MALAVQLRLQSFQDCRKSWLATNLKHELAPRGIAVALLHPGLVATDMTGGHGISVTESAARA